MKSKLEYHLDIARKERNKFYKTTDDWFYTSKGHEDISDYHLQRAAEIHQEMGVDKAKRLMKSTVNGEHIMVDGKRVLKDEYTETLQFFIRINERVAEEERQATYLTLDDWMFWSPRIDRGIKSRETDISYAQRELEMMGRD